MGRGEHSHPRTPQSEVVWFLSEWQMVRVRTGRSANQLRLDFGLKSYSRRARRPAVISS
jgi:hypothetical protein